MQPYVERAFSLELIKKWPWQSFKFAQCRVHRRGSNAVLCALVVTLLSRHPILLKHQQPTFMRVHRLVDLVLLLGACSSLGVNK